MCLPFCLGRYLSGMHEYEVELQFSSTLLGHPDRTHDERGVVDGNEHSFGFVNESLADDNDIHDLLGSTTPLPSSTTMDTSFVSDYHLSFSIISLVTLYNASKMYTVEPLISQH